MLIVLSLLQAAVATALSYDMIFGGAMLVYLPVGVATLLLFFLWRESRGLGALPNGTAPREPMFADDLSLGMIVRQVSLICLLTLILTATSFLAVPRLGRTTWQATVPSKQQVVGISEQVELGELGSVVENPEAVMRISFYDQATNEPYTVTDSLLFRGLHFARYESGAWRQGPAGRVSVLDVNNEPQGAIRQEVTIEPIGTEVLFGVPPLLKHEPNDDVLIDRRREQILRSDRRAASQFRYSLLTTGLQAGRQLSIVPVAELTRDLQMFSEMPSSESLNHLISLAQQLVADLPEDAVQARARRLEGHLRYSGSIVTLSI